MKTGHGKTHLAMAIAAIAIAIIISITLLRQQALAGFARGRIPFAASRHDLRALEVIPGASVDRSPALQLAKQGAANSGDPFPGIPKTRDGLSLEDDPFVATSHEEQQWLDRNGYPNAEQLVAYGRASDAMLADAASQGDRVASVMLVSRQLPGGDPSAAEKLWSLTVDGSSYALTTLAAFYGGSQTYGDPQSAYALSKLAEMRGDYRQALGRDVLTGPSGLNPLERMQAEAQAMRLLIKLNAERRARLGARAPQVDPRPIAGDVAGT